MTKRILALILSLNHTNRQWTLDQFVFLDRQTDLCLERPALMAKVQITTTEKVTCRVTIEQSHSTHTHNFNSGKYTGILPSDCTHMESYDEYCSYSGCTAVIHRQSAVNENRHTARYSKTVQPTYLEKGSYTVYCTHCHAVLHSEEIEKLYPERYDVDLSGAINISDVNEVLVFLATVQGNEPTQTVSRYDLDGNGFVNISDLNDLLIYLATV